MLRAVLFSLLFYNGLSQNEELKEIEYHIFSRGYEVIIKINEDTTNLIINSESEISKTGMKWSNLIEILDEINLNQIENIAAPTENFANDASLAAKLIIHNEKTIYESKTFDNKNPPQELVKLIDYILDGLEL